MTSRLMTWYSVAIPQGSERASRYGRQGRKEGQDGATEDLGTTEGLALCRVLIGLTGLESPARGCGRRTLPRVWPDGKILRPEGMPEAPAPLQDAGR